MGRQKKQWQKDVDDLLDARSQESDDPALCEDVDRLLTEMSTDPRRDE